MASDPNFAASAAAPLRQGAVVALASDSRVMARFGQALSNWYLARKYGFADLDGSRPDWGRPYREPLIPT